jgi:hypothetical protein
MIYALLEEECSVDYGFGGEGLSYSENKSEELQESQSEAIRILPFRSKSFTCYLGTNASNKFFTRSWERINLTMSISRSTRWNAFVRNLANFCFLQIQ